MSAAAARGPDAPADLVLQAPGLAPEAVDAFRCRFPAAVLHPQAASVRLAGVGAAAEAAQAIAELARRWRCDATLVPPRLSLSQFRLLAIDMDSTLIRIECLDELAALAGLGPEVAAITEAAMQGRITDYAQSLRRRVALLAGADASLVQTVADQRMQLSPGAERLLQAARAAGLRTLLVTGGFGCFARVLQQRLGLDAVRANEIEVDGQRLTGVVRGPDGHPDRLIDAHGKAAALKEACARFGCSPAQAIAIGDGANDIPMLALAHLGIAYHAKPKVQESTGYALNHCGLDGVLEWFSD